MRYASRRLRRAAGRVGFVREASDANRQSDHDKRKLLKYRIPDFRMGHLAISRDVQGGGIGKILLGCTVAGCRPRPAARSRQARFDRLLDIHEIVEDALSAVSDPSATDEAANV